MFFQMVQFWVNGFVACGHSLLQEIFMNIFIWDESFDLFGWITLLIKAIFMSRKTTFDKCLFENDDFWFECIFKPNNWFHLPSLSIQMIQQLIKILWFEPNCFLKWKSPFVKCKRVDIQFSPSFDWTHPILFQTFMRSYVIGFCHLRSGFLL